VIFRSQKENNTSIMMMPLRDIVVFPHMVASLFVGRQKSINAVEEALKGDKKIFLATQKDSTVDNPEEENMHLIGSVCTILQMLKLPDGSVKVLVEGVKRCRMKKFILGENYFSAVIEALEEDAADTPEIKALVKIVFSTLDEYMKFNKRISKEVHAKVTSISDPSKLADILAPQLNLKLYEKQELLDIIEPKERLEKIYSSMEAELGMFRVEKKIKTRVRKQMEKSQKDYYLTEQMRAIQKEMGDKDEKTSELNELEEKLESKGLSKEAKAKVDKEIKKLKMMPPMSAEGNVVRNYIDWMLSLPWGEKSELKMDIDAAEKILNEDHYGLKDPKERILEYLAVQSLVKKIKGPIICFVGPPGVGKTSLAKSIARAAGRKFVRQSLGGVRDEAEIRGHRRTYIGALPGKILQSLKKAGTDNPVFLLDEIDKMSKDFQGDPASALLEVLDPEQNNTFNDHYIDVDYDLSQVLFITTANTLQGIPPALQDRMEVIRISGYMESEKLSIAKQFLIAKQKEANGLKADNLVFTDNSVLELVRRYTREAGVRNLEREIASICRKVAIKVVRGGKETEVKVEKHSIEKYLGIPRFRYGIAEEKDKIGITTGLAWTEVGGELLVIEVATMPGKGNLSITGKLGDVMKESAQAAMSYVRSRAAMLGLSDELYHHMDIHIHVPEGAIPKDGPSAGTAITTSIVSALTRIRVKKDIAMTGEITLRGRVLPIGGLKEKIFAAHRGLITTVIIPRENERDLKDIPDKILKKVNIIMVDHLDEVLKQALVLDDPENFLQMNEEISHFFAEKTETVHPPQ